MKKTIAISFLSLILLAGCSNETRITEVPPDGQTRFKGLNADRITIITDSESKCKYIYVEDGGGNNETAAIAPLLKDSKTFDCEK